MYQYSLTYFFGG